MERRPKVKIQIELCGAGAVMPKYARPGDAGMDVFASEDLLLRPGETGLGPTGLKFAVPEGYELQVRPRSGISLNTPLRISNSPGTIDSGFRGEFCVIVTNTSAMTSEHSLTAFTPEQKGNIQGPYHIRAGDRIAQIILAEVPVLEFEQVDSVDAIGNDRKGGFGSTGVKDD
jgi:dUTP pyrophosphatase